jgi:hypothetical protein
MNDLTVNSVMNTVSAVVIAATIIVSFAWIITSIVTSIRQRANTRTRAEVYNRLIDKFGTAPELVDFLQSNAGLRFIEEQTVEVSQPLSKILGSIRLGVSLALIGGGMLIVANLWDRTLGEDLYIVIALGGTVALTAGAGFVIAAAISYKLCKSCGLIPNVETEKPNVR